MARPAKAIDTQSRNNTKAEIKIRKEVETALKGNNDKIKPPKHLTDNQKGIFDYIVGELTTSGILSNLDIYVLTACAIAIDRIDSIEKMINEDIEYLENRNIMTTKNQYTSEFFRCCNELCLSPQSRSKIGSLALQQQKEKQDPLIQILQGKQNDKTE